MVAKEDGQALIEFIIFLPFMAMLYFVVLSLGSSINSSINQQKVTRAFFYHRLLNNSYVTRPFYSNSSPNHAAFNETYGHYFTGWMTRLESNSPLMPCHKLNMPFAPASTDVCEESYSSITTQFIRVGTVYGICGATFLRNGAEFVMAPFQADPGVSGVEQVIQIGSCYNR